ncbi:MAG: proton-conducting transporter transmembrane domain-containing protein, partial [Desulfuromonadaceae bacterium]
ALGQRDLRRMLTYIIIAEVGYMVGGFWLANTQGMTGAILHIFNDAVMTLCLFLAAAAIASRTGSLSFDNLRGLYRTMPVTMAAFTLGAFSIIGVPPTCGFYSKWYLLLGAVQAEQWGFVVALLFSSLANAVIFFRIIELAYFQNTEDHHHESDHSPVKEAPLQMLAPLVVSAAALLIMGFGSGKIVEVIRLVMPQLN